MRGEEERPAILLKTKGSAIMVTDFLKNMGDSSDLQMMS